MRRLAAVVALALPAFLATPSAWAAESMPQLDFANPLTISQIVWMAFIFAAMYFLLSNWALPQVSSVLEMRAAKIDGDLDAARAAKAGADSAVAEVNAATAQARAQAQGAINDASERAKAEATSRASELNAKLDAQLHEAEQRIAAQRAAAMGSLRQVATETTELVVQRLIGHAGDRAAIDGAVGAALSTRGHA